MEIIGIIVKVKWSDISHKLHCPSIQNVLRSCCQCPLHSPILFPEPINSDYGEIEGFLLIFFHTDNYPVCSQNGVLLTSAIIM